MKLALEPCTEKWAAEYADMVREHLAVECDYPYNNYPLALSDFAAFAAELEEEAQGIGLPPDIPAQQTLVVVADDAGVVGEVRFRPRLVNLPPEHQNGHIGYNLRPSARGQGIGTQMIALIRELGRRHNLPHLWATIDADNPASARIVVKNGGFLEREAVTRSGKSTGLYRIPVTPPPDITPPPGNRGEG